MKWEKTERLTPFEKLEYLENILDGKYWADQGWLGKTRPWERYDKR